MNTLESWRRALACRTRGLSWCNLAPLILIGWLLIAALSGCAPANRYQNVSVTELYKAAEPDRLILDVRQPEEFSAGHVPGARLIPLGELGARLTEIPDRAPVYVICHSGNRSRQASELLSGKGKTGIRNVTGGMIAWESAGYPVAH